MDEAHQRTLDTCILSILQLFFVCGSNEREKKKGKVESMMTNFLNGCPNSNWISPSP